LSAAPLRIDGPFRFSWSEPQRAVIRS
jgi:hypothetical protein